MYNLTEFIIISTKGSSPPPSLSPRIQPFRFISQLQFIFLTGLHLSTLSIFLTYMRILFLLNKSDYVSTFLINISSLIAKCTNFLAQHSRKEPQQSGPRLSFSSFFPPSKPHAHKMSLISTTQFTGLRDLMPS